MKRREGRGKAWGKWRKLVSEQGRSGQSVAVFCRERGLCAPYFYAWKKRLREAAAGQQVLRDVCNHIRIATSNVMCLPLTHL